MGKGTISSGGTDGQYQVTINYPQDAKAGVIAELEAQIAALDTEISNLEVENYG